MLRGENGKGVLFITSGTLTNKNRSAHLTFNKYGDRYFLRQVWDENTGTPIPISVEEREILRTQPEAKTAPAKVSIVAQR
jgi:hypothetical protein